MENVYARCFGRVVILGVIVNLTLALPALFFPSWMLGLFHLEPAVPIIWVQFSANLLILLCLFYLPGAIDLYHYRANAWLAVISRCVGVIFFLPQPREYWSFGLLDFAFALPEGILLWLALREIPRPSSSTLSEGV